MSVAAMRIALKKAPRYNYTSSASATWAAKVDKMPEKQVIAIYHRLNNKGEL